VKVCIRNVTRNTELGASIQVAETSAERRSGLLKHHGLAPGEGLWIAPCEAVHTFFMKFAIDLVYLDRRHRVKKVRHAVKPWRLSACLAAHSVVELPAGVARSSGTAPGDEISIENIK
jgi:uncharacterized membrane protein (UPF0127 family)